MQPTEKLNVPYQIEINQLAAIQVQQSELFHLSISEQFDFFSKEYNAVLNDYDTNQFTNLVKKLELVDFMFELHMESFKLPIEFQKTFNLLKIITAKSALYHSAFFVNSHNPVTHYLRTNSHYISQKLTSKNTDECLKLLSKNIQLLIIKYQSDPSFFDDQTKLLINVFKVSKAFNNANKTAVPILKTSSLSDRFTHKVSHQQHDVVTQQNNTHLLTAKRLQKGEWLNLKTASTTILIKLIWKANDDSEFIFVNKEGAKVRQCTLLELASDLEENNISTTSTTSDSTNVKQRNSSFLKTIG